jgi:hypothetical protein
MKNDKNKTAAKEARKTLKKQLNDKLFAQIKTVVGEFESDLKKVNKVIEKASKNLAKALVAKIDTEASPKKVTVPQALAAKDKKVTVPQALATKVAAPKVAAAKKPAATPAPAAAKAATKPVAKKITTPKA